MRDDCGCVIIRCSCCGRRMGTDDSLPDVDPDDALCTECLNDYSHRDEEE